MVRHIATDTLSIVREGFLGGACGGDIFSRPVLFRYFLQQKPVNKLTPVQNSTRILQTITAIGSLILIGHPYFEALYQAKLN